MYEAQARKMVTLIDKLESIPDERFVWKAYVSGDYSHDSSSKIIEGLASPDCGTKACVAGYLPTLFPESWNWCHYECQSSNRLPFLSTSSDPVDGLRCPVKDFATFFGIEEMEANEICDPEGYFEEYLWEGYRSNGKDFMKTHTTRTDAIRCLRECLARNGYGHLSPLPA